MSVTTTFQSALAKIAPLLSVPGRLWSQTRRIWQGDKSLEASPRKGDVKSYWIPLGLFIVLLAAALALMVWLSISYEENARQHQLENDVAEAALELQGVLQRDSQNMQLRGLGVADQSEFAAGARRLLVERPEILLIERRAGGEDEDRTTPRPLRFFNTSPDAQTVGRNERLSPEAALVRDLVRLNSGYSFSGTYFIARPSLGGIEVFELWATENAGDTNPNHVRVVYSMAELLAAHIPQKLKLRNEIVLLDPDGTMLARLRSDSRSAAVYSAKARVDLQGLNLVLKVSSAERSPDLIPNLASGSVVLLGSAFVISLLLMLRDARRRDNAEQGLRTQNQLRKAMEDSLVTGLRARDLEGRVTYVNPAFCEMVGISANELVGKLPPMPYWAPEVRHEYERRFSQVLAGTITRQGYETVFVRRDGSRFPVVIYESALMDDEGKQNGWMASIVDVSEQRRVEELNRQQQDRLQNAARLSTMGEIATVLSHELNQPLAAISTYAAAAKLLPEPDDVQRTLGQIEKQAQRAGHIVHRVHEFMRRRKVESEALDLVQLIRDLLPLIELQARRHWVSLKIETSLEQAPVNGERLMLEQVLLNLTRNSTEAMGGIDQAERELTIAIDATQSTQGRAMFQVSIMDWGVGVPSALAENLFAPFASTKSDGLGIGLNISRSVIEASGGQLWHEVRDAKRKLPGAKFCFVLPQAKPAHDESV